MQIFKGIGREGKRNGTETTVQEVELYPILILSTAPFVSLNTYAILVAKSFSKWL